MFLFQKNTSYLNPVQQNLRFMGTQWTLWTMYMYVLGKILIKHIL